MPELRPFFDPQVVKSRQFSVRTPYQVRQKHQPRAIFDLKRLFSGKSINLERLVTTFRGNVLQLRPWPQLKSRFRFGLGQGLGQGAVFSAASIATLVRASAPIEALASTLAPSLVPASTSALSPVPASTLTPSPVLASALVLASARALTRAPSPVLTLALD